MICLTIRDVLWLTVVVAMGAALAYRTMDDWVGNAICQEELRGYKALAAELEA